MGKIKKTDQDMTAAQESLPGRRVPPPTWDEIGDSFDTMGKVGLAMAIGFSAAGVFCRLAGQGKVRVPNLVGLMTARPEPKKSPKARPSDS